MRTFILSLLIFFCCTRLCLAQTDSVSAPVKQYKNNIQIGLLSVFGHFSLKYERAFTKHISLDLIANVNTTRHAIMREQTEIPVGASFTSQLRYYTGKHTLPNEGFYFSTNLSLLYQQSYEDGLRDSYTKIMYAADNGYRPSPFQEFYDAYYEKLALYMGFGIGYQFVIRKRLLIDVGLAPGFTFFRLERFKDFPGNDEWRDIYYDEYASWWRRHRAAYITLSIGYAF